MNHFKTSICLLLLAITPVLEASPLGLESLVQTALANNRDLQAARYAVWKAKGRLAQAGKWPNPELELSGLSDVVFRNDGAGAFTVGLAQTFPLTARLALARESARVDVLRAIREIRERERLLIGKVRVTTIAILESQASAKALDGLLAAADKTANLAQERLAAGQGSLAERSLAFVDQRRIANELESARLNQNLALMDLKTLLGLGAKDPLEISESLESATHKLGRQIDTQPSSIHRPDVDLLVLEEEKAGIEIDLARAEAWEGVRIGIQYTYDRNMDEPEGLGTDNFLGLGVSMPLPIWDQKKGLVEERTAIRKETRARLHAAKLDIENALVSGLRRIALLKSRLGTFDSQTLDPIYKLAEEMAVGFESGRVDMRDLFTTREQLGKLRLERIAIQSQLALALADFESISGSHPAIRREYLAPTVKTDKKP
jgi:cobalt-zinc-cadmium efflux system outer membrane protein